MATSFVQATSGDNNPNATTVTATLTVTAGNAIVFACYHVGAGSNTVSSFTGTGASGYTKDLEQVDPDNLRTLTMGHALLTATGSYTLTANLSADERAILILVEVAGVDTSTLLDGTPVINRQNGASGTDSVTSGGITTSGPNGAFIFGAGYDTDITSALSIGTGFTQPIGNGNTNSEYLVQAVSGTITNGATFTPSPSTRTMTGVIGLKAAAGGGGPLMYTDGPIGGVSLIGFSLVR